MVLRLFISTLVLSFLVSCGNNEGESFPQSELVVELEREKSAAPMTVEQSMPYGEALVWQQYKVIRVVKGKLSKKVKQMMVGQWCVVGEEERPVDTAVGARAILPLSLKSEYEGIEDVKSTRPDDETPGLRQYIETYQGESKVPKYFRWDYGGTISKQMRAYWELRPQLKAVVMGTSHTGVGVLPDKLMLPENSQTPCVINLSAPGSHMPYQCLMINDYVKDLPKLKWVIWGVSTRSFNLERKNNRRMEGFLASAGRKYDELHRTEDWPVKDAGPLTMADLTKLDLDAEDIWQYWQRDQRMLPVPLDETTRQSLIKQMSEVNSVWWDESWATFESTIKALTSKGVKVMLFIPPVHPLSAETPAVDPDFTSRQDLSRLTTLLTAMDAADDNIWFHDVNQGGKHDFSHEDFFDIDHLFQSGAEKLTAKISTWMKEVDK
ncbi:MAG: hypothetical protein JNJ83_01555 [Verrucomicrobiaceae bacterium]|nr:hypothetical protein [Verrucomicrobiaceae bacterium]